MINVYGIRPKLCVIPSVIKELLFKLETNAIQAIDELLAQASWSVDSTRKIMLILEDRKSSLRKRQSSDCFVSAMSRKEGWKTYTRIKSLRKQPYNRLAEGVEL